MARTKKLTLDEMIVKQKEIIETLKADLAKADEELNVLLEKKNEEKKTAVMDALERSSKSLDDVLEFLSK